jgi:catechol 2,3-dioxygenase-like lactoylglutathione lyase family enzyme
VSASPIPDHAVVGASDPDRAVAFYTAFGFTERRRGTIDAAAAHALYGLDGPVDEVVLGVDGSDHGLLRIVATPLAAPDRGDFHRGGHALDLYSTDVEASVAIARDQGAVAGPIADYPFGPVHLTQAQAYAPDHVPLVFVGIDHRLPSVLDERPELGHSELHSIVACVDGIDAETDFWIDVVGLRKQSAFPIDVPAVSEFMMLPRHAPVRMSVMRGPESLPPRFELLAFDDADGRYAASRPLVPGGLLLGLSIEDVSGFVAHLAAHGARTGEVVEAPGLHGGLQQAAWACTPGGVDFEVRGPTR